MNSWISRLIIYSLGSMIITDVVKGKKHQGKKTMSLPNFKNNLEVRHALSGRIRFYVPMFKNNEDTINMFITQFSQIQGIETVEANKYTGSLLVKYDESKLKPVLIIGIIIKMLNLEEKLNDEPQALIGSEIKNINECLNLAVYDKSNGIIDMKTCLIILFIVLGVYKIRKNPAITPGGITYLWWAYSSICK